MDLSIIYVNWNTEEYVRDSILSVQQYTTKTSYEIIVVDNCSPNGNADVINQTVPSVKLVKSAQNLGFAGANNLGFRRSSGRYVLFLNPDTKLNSPAIDTLVEYLGSIPDAGVVGCKLLNDDLSVQTSCIQNFPGIANSLFQMEALRLRWPVLFGIGPLFSESRKPIPVRGISGACMLLRREVFENLGQFSEDYFMYAEDLDLCFKAKNAGLRNYYVGQAAIIHYGGKSTTPGKQQITMKVKAELRFCRKHRGRVYGWLFQTVSTLNAIGRLALLAILRCLPKSFRGSNWTFAWTKWANILRALLTEDADGRSWARRDQQVTGCSPSNS